LFISIVYGVLRLEVDLSIKSITLHQTHNTEQLNATNKLINIDGPKVDLNSGKEITHDELSVNKVALISRDEVFNNQFKLKGNDSQRYFKIRNYTLLIGFLLIVVSKLIGVLLITFK